MFYRREGRLLTEQLVLYPDEARRLKNALILPPCDNIQRKEESQMKVKSNVKAGDEQYVRRPAY
jgi:hypothetical protein